MKLHEMDPDAILAILESRGDAYVSAKALAAGLDEAHARAKAAAYTAIRKATGCSIEDAKAQALESQTVVDALQEWLTAERAKDAAYLALERARVAVEMWRSIRADLRRV